MSELLLELFSEEIPARMQLQAAESLKKQVTERLSAAQLAFDSAECFATPRRLVLVINGIPTMQEDSSEERKGPRTDAPEAAVEGFLRSAGVTRDQLEARPTPKGEFYFAVIHKQGKDVAAVVKEILETVIANFTWPKSMRWGSNMVRWVRPLQSILCVLDGKTLAVQFAHIRASNTTEGHRFLAGEGFEVKDFTDYRSKLESHYVVLDTEERKKRILFQANALAENLGLKLKKDEGLLDEVAGLVEFPVVLCGAIDTKFMGLPEEVLSTSMRTHQRYFSLRQHNGQLAPYFLLVANTQPDDEGKRIIHGNERVLRARLEDAKFFWEQDQRWKLESRIDGLKKVVFHASLGTVFDKIQRVKVLAKFLSVWVPHASLVKVERAALLAKADLTTEMVKEFPELQGIMGAYYAEKSGEDPDIAHAICEHYSPLGPSDACPTRPLSVAIALADKIDSLVGLFLIGEKPTGSKDPYALRRAALGIIRIILKNDLRIPLKLLLDRAISLYPKAILKSDKEEKPKARLSRVMAELMEFFVDRLKVALKDLDIRYDLINAVFDGGHEDDLERLVMRVKALDLFVNTDDGVNLLAAYKRATNIVRIEEKKDAKEYRDEPSAKLLEQEEEKTLFHELEDIKPQLNYALKAEQFVEAMELVAKLRGPVDKFFDAVQVNCANKDLRENRLLILSQIRQFLDNVANFGLIES